MSSTYNFRSTAESRRGRLLFSMATAGILFCNLQCGARAADNLFKYDDAVHEAELPPSWKGPTQPIAVPKDKFLVTVSCTWALEGCKVAAQAAETLAQRLGWKARTIVVSDPTKYDDAMQTGVVSGADAIFLVSVDQALVKGGLARAKAKHLPVVSLMQYNKVDGTGVDADIHGDPAIIGRHLADSAIVDKKGSVHALLLVADEFAYANAIVNAFTSELDACSECKISYAKQINFTGNAVGTTLPGQVVGALKRDKDINSIMVGFDPASIFTVPAINAAGLEKQATMYSQLGNAAPLSYVRDGNVLTSDVGVSVEWGVWASVDEILRLLQGQSTVDEKLPVQLLTHDTIALLPPPGQLYNARSSGFQEQYLALWGIK